MLGILHEKRAIESDHFGRLPVSMYFNLNMLNVRQISAYGVYF